MKTTIIAILALGLMAQAQTSTTTTTTQTTNESSAKIENLQKKDETMKDTDEDITNARLRAALGSKSKWSVRTAMAYQGGSIEKPADELRPNYRGAVATQTRTYLNADVAVKRRLGDIDSLNFGTGILVYTPFHRTTQEATNSGSGKSNRRNANVSSPYLEYNLAYKLGSLQASSSATYTHSTTDYDVNDVRTIGAVDVSQTLIGEVTTKLSLGASLVLAKTLYKGQSKFDGEGNRKVNLDPGLYPFLEYSFNDKYSFRTVFGYFQFQEFENDLGKFRQLTPYQSAGIGISVTRDIYLYPNVQFAAKNIRSDVTNVGLSANINVF